MLRREFKSAQFMQVPNAKKHGHVHEQHRYRHIMSKIQDSTYIHESTKTHTDGHMHIRRRAHMLEAQEAPLTDSAVNQRGVVA